MARLSHELRNPLTRIRLEVELAPREGASTSRLGRVEQDIGRFDSMPQEMLELSQLEVVGETLVRPEPVDLAGLVRCVLDEELGGVAELRGGGEATGDPRRASRSVQNLLRNAAQHAPGSQRWIEVYRDQIVVGHDGSGIPVWRHDGVGVPVHQGQRSVGHSMGRAIVARIAQHHGGSVTLSTPPGPAVMVCFVGPANVTG